VLWGPKHVWRNTDIKMIAWHENVCYSSREAKTTLPVSMVKTWVADGRHEIVVRHRKHVSWEVKNSLTGLRGLKRVLWFGHKNSTMCASLRASGD
jgi:hypothetical protein